MPAITLGLSVRLLLLFGWETVTSVPIVPPSSPEHSRWFAEEVQPCEAPLRSYLRQSLPSAAEVDDTVQDCFVRLFRAKQKGTVRATKPLLFAIARNAVRDFFARRSRAEVVPITETEALPVLEGKGVVESICHNEELALLTEAINTLPARCREVIILRKVKGLSQREIAEALGISENTVENHATKGARRVAAYLRVKGVTSHAAVR